jgi:hypothetical protein
MPTMSVRHDRESKKALEWGKEVSMTCHIADIFQWQRNIVCQCNILRVEAIIEKRSSSCPTVDS